MLYYYKQTDEKHLTKKTLLPQGLLYHHFMLGHVKLLVRKPCGDVPLLDRSPLPSIYPRVAVLAMFKAIHLSFHGLTEDFSDSAFCQLVMKR